MASIRQQGKNGTWRYRIRYKENGKFREISKSGFRLKSEAQAAAAEIEKSLNKGIHLDESKQTIGEFMDHFLAIRKDKVKASTYTRLEYQTRLYILPKFKFTPIGELTRRECNDWISELSKKLKASTVHSVIGTFHSALTYAVADDRIIEYNPLDHIQKPKLTHDEKSVKYFTHDQLTQLLDYMRDTPQQSYRISKQYYVLFGLLAHTGLRLSEALGLTWDDISGNKLTVNKQLHYDYHNGASFTTPKTESSYRTIAIDPFTQDLLHLQRKNRLEVVAKYKTSKRPTGEFEKLIFYSVDGLPMRPAHVREQMKLLCERAGVPKLSPHAFRHTHAVLLLESGANIKVVSERLGHSTINMTANVYLHITAKMEEDAINRFAEYV